MEKNDTLLLVFVKNAVLGKVKTRLAAGLGHERALAIYKQLMAYTADAVSNVNADKIIFYSHQTEKGDLWDEVATQKAVQDGGGLGERMANAFYQGFASGYRRIVIIGSDCPEITDKIINDAFAGLAKKNVALGKAKDGGYYLLGLSKMRHELFVGKSWSTETVAADTIKDCERLGLSLHELPTLSDIDYVEDWEKMKERLSAYEV